MDRILVIRGGAIGDFILTLPALKLLRDNFKSAHIEILGYKAIVALAENRYYANATRSIEYGPLSRFFARGTELPPELMEYFGSFDLIVSYLFDPDEIFANNLKRCGARQLITASAKLAGSDHAARQLAKPLEQLGLQLNDSAAVLFPNEADRCAAAGFLGSVEGDVIAIHPGSGSETKNWPLQNWVELGNYLLGTKAHSLIVVSGEADEKQMTQLQSVWKNEPVRFAANLPLPHLAAILENSLFVGHDSGISHLAAAAGARCVLLFGPTDPAIWAPMNEKAQVLRATEGDLAKLSLQAVRDQVCQELMRIGIKT